MCVSFSLFLSFCVCLQVAMSQCKSALDLIDPREPCGVYLQLKRKQEKSELKATKRKASAHLHLTMPPYLLAFSPFLLF